MEKEALKELFKHVWAIFGGWAILIVATVMGAMLASAGFGFIATVLSVAAIVAAVALEQGTTLMASFVLGVLLKTTSGTLKSFTAIWLGGAAHDRFYEQVDKTGYVELMLTVFVLTFVASILVRAVSSILRSIQLVRITNPPQ